VAADNMQVRLVKNKSKFVLALCLSLLLVSVACYRDPNVRKQKYLDSGNRYLVDGKVRDASIEFANAIKLDPNFAAAHFGLAEVYEKMGVLQNAFVEFNRTVELDPTNLKAQLELGNFFLASSRSDPENFDKATEKANLVLSKDPNNAQAYALLARIAAVQNKPQEALAQLNKAISLAPNDVNLQYSLGVIQQAQKDYPAAEQTFKNAIALDPKSVIGYNMLSRFYMFQQRWPEVEQTLKQGVEAVPNNLPLRLELAKFYLSPGQKKNEQAQQVLADAKRIAGDNPEARGIIAETEYSSGDTEEAFRDFASLLNDHPRDFAVKAVKARYAELLLQKNHDDEANKQIAELLKANPNDVNGRIVKAQILLKQGKTQDAIADLQNVIKDEPKKAVAHHVLGIAYQTAGDRDQAEAEYRQAILLNPNQLDPALMPSYRALAAIAQAKNDLDLQQTVVEGMLRIDATSADAYLLKANVDINRRNFAAGEEDLRKAIELAPDNPSTYTAMAEWRLHQGKIPEAQALYERALAVAPDAPLPMQGLVEIYLNQKQPDKAKARLKEQIAKSPNTGAFYVMLAELQADGKDFPAAEETLKEGLKLDPNNAGAYLLMARIQTANGRIDEALANFQAYVQHNPKDVMGYLTIAALYESRNDIKDARDMYQKALAIDPNSPAANNNLAYMMLKNDGNIDEVITIAQAALRRSPESASIADTLGYAYYKKGVYSSAIELLEQASKKDPNNASVHYHLGLAYSKANNPAKAREQFQRASQLGPQTADGIAAKKELQGAGE
jgi:tetratricopeptide (TPR) repeat protein